MTGLRVARLSAALVLVSHLAWAQVPVVVLENDVAQNRLVVRIGPVDLPAGRPHEHGAHGATRLPVQTVEIPIDAYLHGFSYELVDGKENVLPTDLLHHLNLIDPLRRELFLPISQRMAAVGKETGPHSIPKFLFGYPVSAGQPMVVSLMLHNPTRQDYEKIEVRFYLDYVEAGGPWPLFDVYPFQLDVAFPAGDKSFDLPPGSSTWSYEASPAMSGKLMGIGGHMHEYATSIRFEDVTTNKLIWEGFPIEDGSGKLVGVTVGHLYRKLGVRIHPDHVYRVSVSYENPTQDTLYAGGMGVVGGIFMPAGKGDWPEANNSEIWYTLDRLHYLRQVQVGRVTTAEEATKILALTKEHSNHHP